MEKISTNIKERVLLFAKSQNISIELFLDGIEMTYGSFKGKAKLGSLNSDAIVNIYTKYPNINLIWLLTGSGSMLMDNLARTNGCLPNISNEKEIISVNNLVENQKMLIDSLREQIQMQKDFIIALRNKEISEHDLLQMKWIYNKDAEPKKETQKK